ncbi:HIG1 domain family member 2A-like [Oppia nitens]|uniref:HIG1 domain family member 2A-like n=1 Tax=Oppia nitens TaxID=1686743 RepID=UPI0023DCD5E3|nr:HIG1 domain family member 2A-like [Oppia nitens]
MTDSEDMTFRRQSMDTTKELEWIELHEKLIDINLKTNENFMTKSIRKFKENPFVPIGICATTFCLVYGLICLRKGDSKTQQKMMRGRIMAQGFTVTAIISGLMYSLVQKTKQKDNQN